MDGWQAMIGHWIPATGDWGAAPKGSECEAIGLQAKALALWFAGCLPVKELRRVAGRVLAKKKSTLTGFGKALIFPPT